MNGLGSHLIVELYDCDSSLIDDIEVIESTLLEAAEISGADIIKHYFHKFSPQGVTGVIVISESHFSIHTWPEYGYCALDIFTCGDHIQNDLALAHIKENLKVGRMSVVDIKRGTLDIPKEKLRHKPWVEVG